MTAAERRQAILHVLSLRGFDTMANLAMEFHVSERTIRRDIDTLSLSEPLYTQTGRYGGGVYRMRDSAPTRRPRIGSAETQALQKILACLERGDMTSLDASDRAALRSVILACQDLAGQNPFK